MSARVTAAHALVKLYPLAWRRRYGDEVGALVEDDPPSLRGLGTLVTGALRAHARPGPWRANASAPERMRLSVWAVFACWIGLSVAGAAFQKETEQEPFLLTHHAVFDAARTAVTAGALLGAAAIALAGLPLLGQALRQARSPGLALRAGLALPVVGLLLFAGITRAEVGLVPTVEGSSTALRLTLIAPWWAAGATLALCCALAPRIVLARVEVTPRSLRRASNGGLVVLVAMALVTAGLAVYSLALVRLDGPYAAQSGGPLLPGTGLVLGACAALAAACTALAAVSATRAFAAARAA